MKLLRGIVGLPLIPDHRRDLAQSTTPGVSRPRTYPSIMEVYCPQPVHPGRLSVEPRRKGHQRHLRSLRVKDGPDVVGVARLYCIRLRDHRCILIGLGPSFAVLLGNTSFRSLNNSSEACPQSIRPLKIPDLSVPNARRKGSDILHSWEVALTFM